jgi:hypothetical protein
MKTYRNPANGYKVTDGGKFTWLWCALFGPLYFAKRGNIAWIFITLILNIFTFGFASIVIAFWARKINQNHLLMKGFKECK